jgi:endonuclease I
MKKSFIVLLSSFLLVISGCAGDSSVTPEKNPPEKENPTPPEKDDDNPDDGGNDDNFFKIPADQIAYYKNVDFSKTGLELKSQLSSLITTTHTQKLSYTPGVWEAIKATDLTPAGNEVYLIYGTPNTKDKPSQTEKYAYTRGKNKNGGKPGDWNREHTYARANGTPNLKNSDSGANTDVHHLRAADVALNNDRGNLKFTDGNGIAQKVNSGWYPGDEWKGDVARMMMYMYLRYPSQCQPKNNAVGSANSIDQNMIDLFLNWNAEDPVSDLEKKRNEYHGNKNNTYAQGNRNPFIDNPYLANVIWGGKKAENKWK